MKLTVAEKKENPLFGRTEITFTLDNPKAPTPSRLDVLKLVAANVSADEKLISLRKIEEKFGDSDASVQAFVYKKKEDLEKSEPAHILKRQKKAEEKVAKAQAEADKKEVEAVAEGAPSPEATGEAPAPEGEAPAQEAAPETPAEVPAEAPAEQPAEESAE